MNDVVFEASLSHPDTAQHQSVIAGMTHTLSQTQRQTHTHTETQTHSVQYTNINNGQIIIIHTQNAHLRLYHRRAPRVSVLLLQVLIHAAAVFVCVRVQACGCWKDEPIDCFSPMSVTASLTVKGKMERDEEKGMRAAQ